MVEKCVKVGQERDECIFYNGEVCTKPEDVPDECGRMAEETISGAQELVFEMMKRASFNEFDGEKVVGSLKANRQLWKDVWMGRTGGYADLVVLRDLHDDCINIDELFIIATEGKATELKALAETWKADEVGWLSKEDTQRQLGTTDRLKVLRIWWD